MAPGKVGRIPFAHPVIPKTTGPPPPPRIYRMFYWGVGGFVRVQSNPDFPLENVAPFEGVLSFWALLKSEAKAEQSFDQ